MCEYCNREGVTIYAWRADAWCAQCAVAYGCHPALLAAAPVGRPADANYEVPFILQVAP